MAILTILLLYFTFTLYIQMMRCRSRHFNFRKTFLIKLSRRSLHSFVFSRLLACLPACCFIESFWACAGVRSIGFCLRNNTAHARRWEGDGGVSVHTFRKHWYFLQSQLIATGVLRCLKSYKSSAFHSFQKSFFASFALCFAKLESSNGRWIGGFFVVILLLISPFLLTYFRFIWFLITRILNGIVILILSWQLSRTAYTKLNYYQLVWRVSCTLFIYLCTYSFCTIFKLHKN